MEYFGASPILDETVYSPGAGVTNLSKIFPRCSVPILHFKNYILYSLLPSRINSLYQKRSVSTWAGSDFRIR